MELYGVQSKLVQDLNNQLDKISKKSEATICDGEPAKKASRLIQSIICGETDENKLEAVWTNQGWSKALA